ncbi:MAG: YvcK family protein [Candidatus Omnitrophica bacterium]|nr:YvcK family protein [Candidatus Omnitrophota bacterium]
MFSKFLSIILSLSLLLTPEMGYAQSAFVSMLPEPGKMVGVSSAFTPVLVKGLVIHPDKPLNFDFIVDSGNDSADQAIVKDQTDRMAKYFLAAITVPEEQLWVNLSPYEKDRVIENDLGNTVLGRDMLAQDYLLKQLTASLIYPEEGLGKDFWAKVYSQAQAKFGTTDIPVDTFNKVWIMPAAAEVFEKGNAVYVTQAKLKVMLDSDRTAMAVVDERASIAKEVMRQIIVPAIEKEVNEGKNFAAIRQVYHAAILAKWYRELIQNTLLSQAYVGQNKIEGVTSDEKALKEEIYQRYIAAYKKGVFDYIKETPSTAGDATPKKYFSGGISDFAMKNVPLSKTENAQAIGVSVGQTFKIDMAMGSSSDAVDRQEAPIDEISEDMIGEAAGLTAPRKFITPYGKLKDREERLKNNTFGIVEVFFPKSGPTVDRMMMFINKLKAEFGDKVYTLDQESLHMTIQGLERQWDNKSAGTLKELTRHVGRDTIDVNKEPVAGVLLKAREIPTSAFDVQVAGMGWDPVGGIFWKIEPYLQAGQAQDEMAKRRSAWDLPSFRAPHITAAYFAQPFNKEETSRLKDLLREYQTTVFGDLQVNELQAIAYEDYSFNAGYRILETVSLEKEGSSPARKISALVMDLAKSGVVPSVNGKKLFDILQASSSGDMLQYIKNNGILSNDADIIALLEVKKRSLTAQALSVDEKEQLSLYEIIFDGHFDPTVPMTVFSGGTGSNRLTEALLRKGAVNLTLLLNAYDDGKSTGDIRRNFDVLGPSDIAKNLVVLLKGKHPALAEFLDHRFPKDADANTLRLNVFALASGAGTGEINQLFQGLDVQTQEILKKYFSAFIEQIHAWERENKKIYNFKDYGVRNMVFLGAYLYYGNDYAKAINGLIADFNLNGKIVLNNHESLWLIAVTENGELLNSEAAVVDGMLDKEIARVFLVRKLLSSDGVSDFTRKRTLEEKLDFIEKKFAVYPQATKESVEAIEGARTIVFAPTTFHSSLSPTLITKGISEALARSRVPKVLIANLTRERGRHTVGEAIQDITKHMKYGVGVSQGSVIDYVVLNTHGYQTNGVSNTNRLPIDMQKIRQEGVEAISIDVDPKSQGKHQGDVTAQVVLSLQGISGLGYAISQGRLIKKSKLDLKEERRAQLKKLLASPILYAQNADRVERLTLDILEINSLNEFVPRRNTRTVILAGGRATRLGSDVAKVLYPIAGRSNLEYLMDAVSVVDKKPLLVIKRPDMEQFQNWLSHHPSYTPELITVSGKGGTANAIEELQQVFKQKGAEDVLLLWGDISNVRQSTLRLLAAVHEALGSDMTIPTSWEENPYAGLLRNERGEVIDVFLTKEHPEQQQFFGEHDGSLFLFKVDEIMPFIHQAIEESGYNEGRTSEVNFLKTIPLMSKAGKQLSGLTNMDVRETAGYNTQQEAELVAQYKQELKDGVPLAQQDIHPMLDSVKWVDEAVNVTYEIRREHKERFDRYVSSSYSGVVFDVDDTLTEDGVVSDEMIDKLVAMINQGVSIGFITGRTNDSLERILLSKIKNHPRLNGAFLNNIYVYVENGTYGYRFDQGISQKFYDQKLSARDIEVASFYLRKYIFGFKDNYSITDHKIHIWPYEPFKQAEYVAKIREMFRIIGLPFTVYKSNSVETTGSILIVNNGSSKGVALEDFLSQTKIAEGRVAKIGDLARRGSVDFELLKGAGSFTVGEFEPESKDQVSIRLTSSELTNEARTFSLLNVLKFEPAAKDSVLLGRTDIQNADHAMTSAETVRLLDDARVMAGLHTTTENGQFGTVLKEQGPAAIVRLAQELKNNGIPPVFDSPEALEGFRASNMDDKGKTDTVTGFFVTNDVAGARAGIAAGADFLVAIEYLTPETIKALKVLKPSVAVINVIAQKDKDGTFITLKDADVMALVKDSVEAGADGIQLKPFMNFVTDGTFAVASDALKAIRAQYPDLLINGAGAIFGERYTNVLKMSENILPSVGFANEGSVAVDAESYRQAIASKLTVQFSELLKNDIEEKDLPQDIDVLMIPGTEYFNVYEKILDLKARGVGRHILISGGTGRVTIDIKRIADARGFKVDKSNEADMILSIMKQMTLRHISVASDDKEVKKWQSVLDYLESSDVMLEKRASFTVDNFLKAKEILKDRKLLLSGNAKPLKILYIHKPVQQLRTRGNFESVFSQEMTDHQIEGISFTTTYAPNAKVIFDIVGEFFRIIANGQKGDWLLRTGNWDPAKSYAVVPDVRWGQALALFKGMSAEDKNELVDVLWTNVVNMGMTADKVLAKLPEAVAPLAKAILDHHEAMENSKAALAGTSTSSALLSNVSDAAMSPELIATAVLGFGVGLAGFVKLINRYSFDLFKKDVTAKTVEHQAERYAGAGDSERGALLSFYVRVLEEGVNTALQQKIKTLLQGLAVLEAREGNYRVITELESLSHRQDVSLATRSLFAEILRELIAIFGRLRASNTGEAGAQAYRALEKIKEITAFNVDAAQNDSVENQVVEDVNSASAAWKANVSDAAMSNEVLQWLIKTYPMLKFVGVMTPMAATAGVSRAWALYTAAGNITRAKRGVIDAILWLIRNNAVAAGKVLNAAHLSDRRIQQALKAGQDPYLVGIVLRIHASQPKSFLDLARSMGATGKPLLEAQIERAKLRRVDAQEWLIRNISTPAKDFVEKNGLKFNLSDEGIIDALVEMRDPQQEFLRQEAATRILRTRGETRAGLDLLIKLKATYQTIEQSGNMNKNRLVNEMALLSQNNDPIVRDRISRELLALKTDVIDGEAMANAHAALLAARDNIQPVAVPPDAMIIEGSGSSKDRWLGDANIDGGIDIKNIDVKKTGNVRIQFNDQAVRDVLANGFNGFTPVILNITPMKDPLMALGIVPGV